LTYSAQIFVDIEYTRDKPNGNGQKERVFKPIIIRAIASRKEAKARMMMKWRHPFLESIAYQLPF
jgi:hypothetical protein